MCMLDGVPFLLSVPEIVARLEPPTTMLDGPYAPEPGPQHPKKSGTQRKGRRGISHGCAAVFL